MSEAPTRGQKSARSGVEAGANQGIDHASVERIDPSALIQREAPSGSYSFDDPDRPRWDLQTAVVAEYKYRRDDGSYAYSVFRGRCPDGVKTFRRGRRVHGTNELVQAQRDDELYRFLGLEGVRIGTGDEPDILYRLDELVREMAARPDDPVFITEGEKDADNLRSLGFIATTNPNGALNWKPEFNRWFAGRDVVVMVDNDARGRERRDAIVRQLLPVARSVKAVELPGLPPHGDVSDWLARGHTADHLLAIVADTPVGGGSGSGVQLSDFHAFMPSHNYIFAPSGEPWPSTSVNARIPPIPLFDTSGAPMLDEDGEHRHLVANRWLDEHRPVEQMTWAPGEDQVIKDRLIAEGGWISRPGCNVFNLYRPPATLRGDPSMAGPWLDHVRTVYPDDADHIINWLAHRVQLPQEKINHALVMGGAQGIGKDTILEPVKAAIGHWNFAEVSPQHMLGRFNGFVKSVILRVSEARDLGDVDRFAFYDHMKTYTAAPPDVLRVDEKFMREYAVFNVCGVIITSNHKTNGIYLPEDDRRHFVAWSELSKDDFTADYWQRLWRWYERGGIGHVAAYLTAKDILDFRPKVPPPKTQAFWDIVTSNSAPEEAELTDALEKLGWPDAVTLSAIGQTSEPEFAAWLRDKKNGRSIPHKMEECGYRTARNPTAKSGRWKVEGKDVMIYARKELSIRDAISAAERRAREGNNVPM